MGFKARKKYPRCIHVLFEMDDGTKLEYVGNQATEAFWKLERLARMPYFVLSSLDGIMETLNKAEPTKVKR